jgi:hypothetical protein
MPTLNLKETMEGFPSLSRYEYAHVQIWYIIEEKWFGTRVIDLPHDACTSSSND